MSGVLSSATWTRWLAAEYNPTHLLHGEGVIQLKESNYDCPLVYAFSNLGQDRGSLNARAQLDMRTTQCRTLLTVKYHASLAALD